MQVAAEGSREIRDALKNAVGVTIDAVKAFHILSNIPKEDYPLLCMSVESNNASNLILTTVPGIIFKIFFWVFFDYKFITKLQVHFETFFKDPKFFKFWKVSPSVIRPSIASDVRQGTNEDDLTTSLMHIIQLNNTIENGIENGKDISGVQGRVGWCWEVIQAQHALMINSQESERFNFRIL